MSHTKYVDPLLDLSFKRIFGTDPNKDLLIALLNSIFKGKKHIIDLVYNQNEHHGENKNEGSAIFDLLCTGDRGERFLIEVQTGKPVNFKKRALFYTSRLISGQAPKGNRGKWEYNITDVFFVAILEQELEAGKEYLHDIYLCNSKTGEIFYEGLGYTFIELSNFVKTSSELESDLDRWLYSLKHLSEMDDLPLDLRKPVFEKLYTIAEYTKMTKEEQEIYDAQRKRKWDNEAVKEQQRIDLEQQRIDLEQQHINLEQQRIALEERAKQIRTEALLKGLEQGLAEGLEQGLSQGLEQGLEQGRTEGLIDAQKAIAIKMKQNGVSTDMIMKYTNLSAEEIQVL